MSDPQATSDKSALSVAEVLRHDIEHTLETRHAKRGTRAAKVEERLKRLGQRLWDLSQRRPLVGVAIAAGGGFALAMVTGVGELAVATTFGYAAYRVLALREEPREAIRQVARELTRGE
jgi:ElaB/YqjD/DUF883 family membrane-anchored ribosome-binding protein